VALGLHVSPGFSPASFISLSFTLSSRAKSRAVGFSPVFQGRGTQFEGPAASFSGFASSSP
jgi:hypothetical protein